MFLIERPPLHKNFFLPSREELLKLKKGSSVKLIFSAGDDVERMWVTLIYNSDMDRWEGILDNQPVTDGLIKELVIGQKVIFHPLDIIQIYRESIVFKIKKYLKN